MTDAKKIRELIKLGSPGITTAISIMVGKNYPVSKIVNIIFSESGVMDCIDNVSVITGYREPDYVISLHKDYYVTSRRSHHKLNTEVGVPFYNSKIYHGRKSHFMRGCRKFLRKELTDFIKETYDYDK